VSDLIVVVGGVPGDRLADQRGEEDRSEEQRQGLLPQNPSHG
jgi:hypothetical protein